MLRARSLGVTTPAAMPVRATLIAVFTPSPISWLDDDLICAILGKTYASTLVAASAVCKRFALQVNWASQDVADRWLCGTAETVDLPRLLCIERDLIRSTVLKRRIKRKVTRFTRQMTHHARAGGIGFGSPPPPPNVAYEFLQLAHLDAAVLLAQRNVAAEVLSELNAKATPWILRHVTHLGGEWVKQHADLLLRFVADESSSNRYHALNALLKLEPAAILHHSTAVAARLGDPDATCRCMALTVLQAGGRESCEAQREQIELRARLDADRSIAIEAKSLLQWSLGPLRPCCQR